MSKDFGWIGVDLDGTLAHYDRWRGEGHIGEPILPMLYRVQDWLAEGKQVKIFTARVGPHGRAKRSREEIVQEIQGWCQIQTGHLLEVTHEKDFAMIELWDDRAVQVIPNTGIPIDESRR